MHEKNVFLGIDGVSFDVHQLSETVKWDGLSKSLLLLNFPLQGKDRLLQERWACKHWN
jgi:nucleoid-associated protein YejK